MKVIIIYTCLAIWAFDLALRSNDHQGGVHAQNWNISKVYKPIEFEWTHRGSFNMSYCSREMINCYEIFELQAVCGYYDKRDSICSAMTRHCNDLYGFDSDYQWGMLDIADEYCTYWWTDNFMTL